MPHTRTNAPRGALIFDTRLLGRQAGSALTQTRIVPAPEDMHLELVRVPVGADMTLEVRFEAVTEGVLATGTVTAPLAGECARCLAPLASSVTASFQELFLYPDERPHGSAPHGSAPHGSAPHGSAPHGSAGRGPAGRGAHDKHDRHHWSDRDEPEEQDDEQLYLHGDLLDLEPMLRDAIVLALPMSPLCRDDCPGLCVECGVPLADAGPDHRHAEATDPRWARLKQL